MSGFSALFGKQARRLKNTSAFLALLDVSLKGILCFVVYVGLSVQSISDTTRPLKQTFFAHIYDSMLNYPFVVTVIQKYAFTIIDCSNYS